MRISKELSRQGAARFGLDLDTLRFLGGEDGDVYEGMDAGGAFIFKLVPSDADNIAEAEARVDFSRFLSDNGVRIARPLPSPQGKGLEILESGGQIVIAGKVTKALGHHPTAENPREWNASLFREWGRVIGQMHALTKRYAGGEVLGQWDDEVGVMTDWCRDPEVKLYWQRMRAHLEMLPRMRTATG